MDVYLASPNTQQQAEHCSGMPVLLSYASFSDWLWQYQPTFEQVLIDSGAYTEMTTGKKVAVPAFGEWSQPWRGHAVAIADERERCAKIADKQADTLRRAAHVVQQPTEEALRMAELAILQLSETARAIRRDSTGEKGS